MLRFMGSQSRTRLSDLTELNKTQLSEVGVAILNKIIDKLMFSWEVGQVYFKFSIP